MRVGVGVFRARQRLSHCLTGSSLVVPCAGHGEDREEGSEAAAGRQAQGEKARPARHWCVSASSRVAAGEARRSTSCLFLLFRRLLGADRAGALRQGEGKRNRGSKPWKANAKGADQDDRCESHGVLRVRACVSA